MNGYTRVVGRDEIAAGEAKMVWYDDTRVVVVNTGDAFYAIDDLCSHADAPLSSGEVVGCEIACPLHGARFDLRTGEALSAPAYEAVTAYDVLVDGQDVLIKRK